MPSSGCDSVNLDLLYFTPEAVTLRLLVQEQGRSAEALAAVAAKHGCSVEQLASVVQYTSVPAIHTGLVEGKHALRAVWQ